jgi:putative inorganic carbon (HCO3(-)) transporter
VKPGAASDTGPTVTLELAPTGVKSQFPITVAALAMTAAIAPAYVGRFRVGVLPTTALEVAIGLTIGVFLIESLKRRAFPDWRSPMTIPAIVFLIAGAISVVDAPSQLAALGVFRAYLLEPILIALVVLTAVRTSTQAKVIIVGFSVGATFLALADGATVLAGIKTNSLGGQLQAPVAFYDASNAIALYLVPVIAVAGAIALHGSRRRLRAWLTIFCALASAATILTLSRGGWAALALVGIGLALTHPRSKVLLIGLAVLVLVLALIPGIQRRVADGFQISAAGALNGRAQLWPNTLVMLDKNPLLGAGLSGFIARVESAVPGYVPLVMYPHNIVLNFWSETGLLGLVAFVACIGIAFWISWRGWREGQPDWRPIHLGVLLAIVAILVHGLVDVPYFKNDLALEFWILVGLTLCGRRLAPSQQLIKRVGVVTRAQSRETDAGRLEYEVEQGSPERATKLIRHVLG